MEQDPSLPKKKQKTENRDTKENPVLREFYWTQLNISEADFQAFFTVIKTPLPVTFRVNSTQKNYQAIIDKLNSPAFNTEIFQVTQIPWYPCLVAYEANSNRTELRKIESVKSFHSYLLKANDSGLITRQELVSMIPPLVLNLQQGQTVLDICAAPGSKTAQIIELINGIGLVVANEIDKDRAYMLIHQLHRSNTSCMAVINHPAQNLPNLYSDGSLFQFDRVLCDVPCTGDGAIRKMPQRWKNWSVKDGYSMHGLQTQILIRALQLCKIGGFVCYSTCSLNPIENEAVVAGVMRKFGGSLKIMNLHEKMAEICPGFIVRKGLRSWKMLGGFRKKEQKMFEEFKSYQEIPETTKYITEEMFPINVPEDIENTIRIMPNDQNTGGFYIALLYKTAEISTEICGQDTNEMIIDNEENKAPKKHKHENREAVVFKELPVDNEAYLLIKECYGFENSEEGSLFYTNENCKNIFYASSYVKNLLEKDPERKLAIFNIGVQAFTKNREKESSLNCIYRPMQDALPFISKHINKRKITCRDIQVLKHLINNGSILIENINDKECSSFFTDLGYYVISFPEISEDIVVLKNSTTKLTSMIPKEHIESLKIRYTILE